MKIKVIVIGLLLILLRSMSVAQQYDSSNVKLPVFQVDECLHDLLKTVAESNKQHYKADQYFYSVIFQDGKQYRYLSIVPERWLHSRYMDYCGIMKFSDMSFLFRGDVERDSIFKKTALPGMEVSLKKTTVDPDDGAFFREPSLQGMYYVCKGMAIYMEIYTTGEVGYYKMKIPKSKQRGG